MIIETNGKEVKLGRIGVMSIEGKIIRAMIKLIPEVNCFEKRGHKVDQEAKNTIIQAKGIEEKSDEETILETMGKMINEVKCFEGIKVNLEKEMHLKLEVKGFEASCPELMSMEVMGPMNIEKVGNTLLEVVHFEMKNIEVSILEVEIKIFEVSGLEVKWSKLIIIKEMDKRYIDVMDKMTVEV